MGLFLPKRGTRGPVPTAPQPPPPSPIHAAAAPDPAELRTRSRSGREWAPAAPPPRQTDRRLGQSLPGMLPSDQSAHRRGGGPLTSRPLLASMGPAAAAARGPGHRSPPVGAMLRLVLAVTAMLVVVLLRRRPRRPRRWPPHCCLTVVRHLERGLRACRTPATKHAAIGRWAARHAGSGSLRGHAGAGLRRGRDYNSRQFVGMPRGGAPVAGGLPHTGQPRGCPAARRAAARPPARTFPAEAAVLASPPTSCLRGGSSLMRAAPIGLERRPPSPRQPIGVRDTAAG